MVDHTVLAMMVSHRLLGRFGSLSALISAFATLHSFSLIWIIEKETEVLEQDQPTVKE